MRAVCVLVSLGLAGCAAQSSDTLIAQGPDFSFTKAGNYAELGGCVNTAYQKRYPSGPHNPYQSLRVLTNIDTQSKVYTLTLANQLATGLDAFHTITIASSGDNTTKVTVFSKRTFAGNPLASRADIEADFAACG